MKLIFPLLLSIFFAAPAQADSDFEVAFGFLQSRLNTIDKTKSKEFETLRIYFEANTLDFREEGIWDWSEQFFAINKVALSDSITARYELGSYQVDPKDLAYPATVGHFEQFDLWYIRMECFNSDCITFDGLLGEYDGKTDIFEGHLESLTSKSSTRETNVFWFNDQRTAERVAKALTQMLRLSGAQEHAF